MFNITKLISDYKTWNIFERRYFWSGTFINFFVVFYSLNTLTSSNISLIYKLGVISAIIILGYLTIAIFYKSLSRQEREWKGVIIDPLTNKEIVLNNITNNE